MKEMDDKMYHQTLNMIQQDLFLFKWFKPTERILDQFIDHFDSIRKEDSE